MTKRQKEFYDYLQKLKAYDNPKFVETALREFLKYWEQYEKQGCKDSMTLAMESTEAFVGLPIVAKPCEVEKMKESNKLSVWKNKKTGNLYVVLYDEAIECTNGREDIDYTVYTSINDVKDMNGKIFVRQTNEFYQKFERVNL